MNKYKSNLERSVASLLKKKKIKFQYESQKVRFVQPAKKRVYKPDFELLETGTLVECKGRLTSEDRKKLLWVKEQHPDLHLVILFQKADNAIRKGSKTTYAAWADANGFDWSDWDEEGIKKTWTTTKTKGNNE